MKVTEKLSYILGFMWADGYIVASKKNKTKHVGMYLNYDDFLEIENLIKDVLGINKFYERYQINRKKQKGFLSGKVHLYKFFYDLDYGEKSYKSPNKLLNFIGENNYRYWLRGLIDGDGSIFVSKRASSLSITSTYDYDWSSIIQLIKNQIGIDSIKLYKTKSKKTGHSLSRIVFQRINDIDKIFAYIYPNKHYDYGLKRKFNKFKCNEYKKTVEYKNDLKEKKNSKITIYQVFDMKNKNLLEFKGRLEFDNYFKELSKNKPKKEKINYQHILKIGINHKGYILKNKITTNKNV